MANRTYLYATDLIPTHENAGQPRRIVGLSETSYAMPMMYGILVAGEPVLCLSNIWTFRTAEGAPSQPLALAAPFDAGLAMMRRFQQALTHPAARAVVDEAVDFLQQPKNALPYLLLEAAEYFDMFDEDDPPKGKLYEKVAALQTMLTGDISESMAGIAAQLNALPTDDLAAAKKQVHEEIGYCAWSNVLYQQPGPTGAA